MPELGNFSLPDLTELYSRPYNNDMMRWRQIGAADKALHILQMVRRNDSTIETILEVGCGTGAVLQALAKAGLGSRLSGIEIGSQRSTKSLSTEASAQIEINGYDGHIIPYPDQYFDLVFATHVLEHVLNPREFLREMRRVSRSLVFIEIPCELHLRTSMSSLQTSLDIGHINAYTPESLVLTLETSGLRVKKIELFDHGFAVHSFHRTKFQALLKIVIRRALLKVSDRLASRIFTYHCAALCERGPLLEQ